MRRLFYFFICNFILFQQIVYGIKPQLGIDRFFNEGFDVSIKKKRVGLITNHTGVDSNLTPTLTIFREKAKEFFLTAIFCPEHGLHGHQYAFEKVKHSKDEFGVPIFSLHGDTRRPTEEMLKMVDVLIYDIQDIGCRSYTYATTLFYVMEEAAKKKIPVIVLDRPNPLGDIVDGPMLEEKWRSFIGYVNVPYCHGMTIGELAQFFNKEYSIGCDLTVIPMKGWRRDMLYKDTGLAWLPTSPHIPEADTPLYYATTGILGELGIVNIGVGFTLPFKIIGAPWINAQEFTKVLNSQQLPGVSFAPFHFRPYYGPHKGLDCQGALIAITDARVYRPLSAQYLLIGILKSLYPKIFSEALAKLPESKKELFCKANGNHIMFEWLKDQKYVGWPLIEFQKKEREAFLNVREKYLLKEYSP